MRGLSSGLLAVVLLALVLRVWQRRRQGTGIGPGAAGAFYEMLDQDKRSAVEVIVEQETGYRDPEDRDGNLADFERRGPPVPRQTAKRGDHQELSGGDDGE